MPGQSLPILNLLQRLVYCAYINVFSCLVDFTCLNVDSAGFVKHCNVHIWCHIL